MPLPVISHRTTSPASGRPRERSLPVWAPTMYRRPLIGDDLPITRPLLSYGVLSQPIGQHAAWRARPEDDVIRLHLLRSPELWFGPLPDCFVARVV